MSIFTLLGFGTNWDRVNKNKLIQSLYSVGIVVFNIVWLLKKDYDYDMEKFLKSNIDGIKREWAYKVIIAFGSDCPTKSEYPKFKEFVSVSHLIPSAKEVQKNPELQQNWDIAYQWALEYQRSKRTVILQTKQETNRDLENQLKQMEVKITTYERKLADLKAERKHSLLLKDQKISELNEYIAKKQWKYHKSERKKDYKEFKKVQKKNLKVELSKTK